MSFWHSVPRRACSKPKRRCSPQVCSILTAQETLLTVYAEREAAATAMPIDSQESSPDLDQQISDAEYALDEAKAAGYMRDSALWTTLIVKPILKAIHGGTKANRQERVLLPLLQRRDQLTSTSLKLTQTLNAHSMNLTELTAQRTDILNASRDLTTRLMELTDLKKQKEREQLDADEDLKERVGQAEAKAVNARQRWEVVRNVVQGIIVASGVDWVEDDQLRELVLSCGDEIAPDDG